MHRAFGLSLFNLDLDYFFDKEGMLLYTDEYIKAFAHNLYNALENIAVLTIAMSLECCGGWDKSVNILRLFSEIFGFDEVLQLFD